MTRVVGPTTLFAAIRRGQASRPSPPEIAHGRPNHLGLSLRPREIVGGVWDGLHVNNLKSEWQRADGFPADVYFDTVENELLKVGIEVDPHREEDWNWVAELSPQAYGYSASTRHGLWLAWLCEEEDEPLAGGFTGPGWYLVPYSKEQALGDRIVPLHIAHLAEPAEVAAQVLRVVTAQFG